jgi:signal transduction histidine kinase
MIKWEESIRDYLSYMNSVISTLKGQVSLMSDSSLNSFTVGEVFKGIDILMKHEFKKASVGIKYNIRVDENVKIPGNINFLLQVLDNIIVNAIDSYEDKKGAVVEIGIGCKDDKIEIAVRDYGKGIPREIHGKLFKQMVTTKGKNGTGLGLYISRSIITSKLGGEIEFDSAEGEGSTFIVRMPVED